MYERLLNLIDYEKDLNVKKELEIVKHKILLLTNLRMSKKI